MRIENCNWRAQFSVFNFQLSFLQCFFCSFAPLSCAFADLHHTVNTRFEKRSGSNMTGRNVLQYKIGERLGTGGMGEVYLAEDTRLGRNVALKFLPASYQYDPDRRERFVTEARAASALRSPYTAAIYDIGEFDGASFIVMEFV